MPEKERIAVIGAGLMGHGISQIFAIHGYSVTLMDLNTELLSKAVESIRSNLMMMAGSGIGSESEIEPAVARIKLTTDLQSAVSEADFVVEAVLEKLELKQDIFRQIDKLCPPDTILATNTSVISITEIARKSKLRGRIVGTHFWNPPYLIPLVEVIPGAETEIKTADATFKLLKKVGKHPVRIRKDVPGFVGNRLQHALWREAVSIVERGIADAATVDECVKFGFGLRLPVLGPMENVDMVGTDLTLAIHDYIFKHLESSSDPSPLLKEMVRQGNLGFKSGQGFQKWSPAETQAAREKLIAHLLEITKKQL